MGDFSVKGKACERAGLGLRIQKGGPAVVPQIAGEMLSAGRGLQSIGLHVPIRPLGTEVNVSWFLPSISLLHPPPRHPEGFAPVYVGETATSVSQHFKQV